MGLPLEPLGVGTPDLGWQQSGRRGRAAAARTSTTPAETLAGTQASPHHYLYLYHLFSSFLLHFFFLSQALFSFCRVVARFLWRVVQMLDRPVSVYSQFAVWGLRLYWWL